MRRSIHQKWITEMQKRKRDENIIRYGCTASELKRRNPGSSWKKIIYRVTGC